VKKHSYSWEDASYLTQRSLGIPLDRWRHIGKLLSTMNQPSSFRHHGHRGIMCSFFGYLFWILQAWSNLLLCILMVLIWCLLLIDEATREDLVLKRLWEKSNMESYVADMRKESKRRR